MFDTPELIASLARYSEQLPEQRSPGQSVDKDTESTSVESLLYLRVQAAASYYSTNRTLMGFPPPVDVDISTSNIENERPYKLTWTVLDPFLLNIFPRSLGPVAIYITAVAIGAWFLSGYIYRWLLSVVSEAPSKPHTD